MNVKILITLIALVLLASGAYAYQGFNRYYYTDNYQPTVYYPNPSYANAYATTYNYYGSAATYPAYYNNYYPSYNTYYAYPSGTYYYPAYNYTYTAPSVSNYRTFGAYRGDSGWGFYYSSGSACSYYGYC
jgi:hypothetical protein